MTRRAYFETPKAKKPGLRFNLWDIIRCAILRAMDEPRTQYRMPDFRRNYAGYDCPSYYPIK